jgi:hypothetical protein
MKKEKDLLEQPQTHTYKSPHQQARYVLFTRNYQEVAR